MGQTGDGRSITERLAELDARTGQIDARLAELDQALAAIDRVRIDAAEVARALARFDPVWDVLRVREQTILPDWLAWETFGLANGVDTFEGLRAQLRRIQVGARIEADPELPGLIEAVALQLGAHRR